MLAVVGNIDPTELTTELKFADGCILQIPTALLQAAGSSKPTLQRDTVQSEGTTIVPIIEEQLVVSKRVVPTAQVRLQKSSRPSMSSWMKPLQPAVCG